MNTNKIGLNKDKAKILSEKLNVLLANYSIFYQNTRGYHWNIKGARFFELHLKFEELYNDLLLKIDEVAERLREHWRLVVGLLPEDHAILRQHGYTPLDEDADLRVNRDAFKRLAIQLGFAWEPSDGLVLFSLTPDQFC